MSNEKQFLVSVADVIIRDPNTHDIVLTGRTLMSSDLKQAVSEKEVRGGFGNSLQYIFNYQKTLTVDISDSVFKEEYIALSNGTSIVNELSDLYVNGENITISGGTGTLTETPITGTSVFVELPDGTVQTVSPSGKNITLTGFTDGEVKATYRYDDTVDIISIDADKYPIAYDVTLIAKMFTGAGQNKEIQINIPKLKFDGNFDISLSAENVVAPKITGKALATIDNVYAKVKIKKLDTSVAPIQQIAVTTPTIALTSSNNSKLLNVIGIRGGLYANVVVPLSDLTLTSSATGVCTINGTTKAIEFVAAGTATVTVELTSDPTIKDIVSVTCS